MLCVVTVRNLLLPLVLFFPFYSFPFPFLLFYKTLFPPHFLLHTITSFSPPLFYYGERYSSSFFWHIKGFLFGLLYLCMLHTQSCPILCNPVDCSLQSPLPMGFFRPDKWSGLPFPPPGDRLNLEIEPASFMSPTLAGKFFTMSATWEKRKNAVNYSKGHYPEIIISSIRQSTL